MNERESEDEKTEQIQRESVQPLASDDTAREEWGILTPFAWFFGVI